MSSKKGPLENPNLALWHRFYVTDPSQTKTFKRGGGFSGTAIRPFWVIMRATEEFGPAGKGWGWQEVEHKIHVTTDDRAVWFSKVVVWYTLDGQRHETGPQWGATEMVGVYASGKKFFDEEAAKKAVTDGIMKCLSYLGLAGDVHMGNFDDSKYVAEAREHYREKDGAAAGRKVETADADAVAWREQMVATVKATTDEAALKTLWESHKATFRSYSQSGVPGQKAVANFVKSQIERRLAELRQHAAGDPDATEADTEAA
jgi:hypothetical protein